jgi:hypothetical protein
MTPYGYPSDQYHCLLDEQPYYLVPHRLLPQEESVEDLIVNPSCWFSWHGPLPADKGWRTAFAEYLCPSQWMVWVDDPASQTIWPYWVGEEYANFLSNLAPGYPVSSEISPKMKCVLMTAGILIRLGWHAWRRRQWQEQIASCAEAFRCGYVNAGGVLPALHVGSLRRYYRYHVRTGDYALGDSQVPSRFIAHNEPVARFFLHQLAPIVSDIARTTVKPSYAYMAAYQSGARLERHTDRPQCEYSVSLCLDATPEPVAQSWWPIQLDNQDGQLKVWQFLGDSLFYRGCAIPHSRETLPEGYTSTSLLFHYVDESFDGELA